MGTVALIMTFEQQFAAGAGQRFDDNRFCESIHEF
jgi:hypothetical protein